MKSSFRSKKTVIWLAVVALVLFVGEGMWFYRSYQSAQNRLVEAKKAEVAVLIRGRAATELSPEVFANAMTDANQTVFRDFFARIQSPQVVRMKVWNRDAVVLWSNLPEIIGQKFPDNDEVKDAYGGEVVLKVEEQKAEHVSERQYASLAEIYVPLYDASGKAFGVVEIYEPTLLIDGPASDEMKRTAVPVGAVTVVAYAVLAAALLRGAKRKRPARPSGQAPQGNQS